MKLKIKEMLSPFFQFLISIGFDPRRLLSLRFSVRYLMQYFEFKKLGGAITHKLPILLDYEDTAGSASGHYFHQDLIVASLIHQENPDRHIDIGSRIDGFVAHVASFRKIDVMDVRDLNDTGHQNISFIKANLMDKQSVQDNITDSISCLHAIEHFGLGRYGDPLDPSGYLKGFSNIVRMLKSGGTLYISFPIGERNEVHFNAHRVFHPTDILKWPTGGGSLKLERFDFVDDDGILHQNVNLQTQIFNLTYGCGVYTFKKI